MVEPLGNPSKPLPDPGDEFDWIYRPGFNAVRVYHRHPDRPPLVPRTWGPDARLDHQVRDRYGNAKVQPDGRGVIYLAGNLPTALAEALPGRSPVEICPNRYLIVVQSSAPALLLDISGDGAMRIGAVATLGAGDEKRRKTQRWARRIYEDLPRYQGIGYTSAHQGGGCVVLNERAPRLVAITPEPGYWLLGPEIGDRVRDALDRQGRTPEEIPASGCKACRDAGLA